MVSMKILVTGGAGFIGSAFVRYFLGADPVGRIVILDKLTYAGNLENLDSSADAPRYRFVQGDICDAALVDPLLGSTSPMPSCISRRSPTSTGALSSPIRSSRLTCAARLSCWKQRGELAPAVSCMSPPMRSTAASPSRSKTPRVSFERVARIRPPRPVGPPGAVVLHYLRAACHDLPGIQHYGPYQFPEKLMPLLIANAVEDLPLPVYGDGMQRRDWLYVEDHCRGILAVLRRGQDGEIYNIGGNRSLPNLEVVRRILELTGKPESLIRYVADRPGHDRRYALSSEKLMRQTGWRPEVEFEAGLAETVEWYRNNQGWVERVRSGDYRTYYERNYSGR